MGRGSAGGTRSSLNILSTHPYIPKNVCFSFQTCAVFNLVAADAQSVLFLGPGSWEFCFQNPVDEL